MGDLAILSTAAATLITILFPRLFSKISWRKIFFWAILLSSLQNFMFFIIIFGNFSNRENGNHKKFAKK